MYIIAEIAQAHDGSLGNALKFIEAAKLCGADAVKFQAHIADAESTREDKFRVNTFPQDKSRFEYWKRMEFSNTEWGLINEKCLEQNIDFIVSPFSVESVKQLCNFNIKYFKVGSGEILNLELLETCTATHTPIILSSGMSNWDELKKAADFVKKQNADFSFLQCTSKYPCKLSEIGLNIIQELKDNLKCIQSGLSDHSGDEDVGIAACALGCEILEVHICWSKHMFGPDTSSSLDLDQLKRLCEFRDKMNLLKNPVDKDRSYIEFENMRKLFGRSLVASRNIAYGEAISEEMISFKKPGGGLSLEDKPRLIGAIANREFVKDELFYETDLI
tara:strand:+ start:7416 stop:8411 length:996 start_codon:yes stop_codon:yes gene_type:complete